MSMYQIAMPHEVSVLCPSCQHHAIFHFSKSQPIDKKHRSYFEKSKNFKTTWEYDNGWKYHAWHDRHLNGDVYNIRDLPEGFSPENFTNKPFYYYSRRNASRGVIVCNSCDFRRLHKLSWPNDAYFKINYKTETLWAFNREMVIVILNYLKSSDRKKRVTSTTGHVSQHTWLRKIPTVFQTKKSAPHVIKKLEKILK
ncbi:MAG: hypothetical protein ABJ275_00045 [Maricaulaceae bacterium]